MRGKMNKKNKEVLIEKLRSSWGIFFILASILMIIFYFFGLDKNTYYPAASTPTATVTATSTGTPTGTPEWETTITEPPPESYESTGIEDDPVFDKKKLRVGELQVEYPPIMTIRESETIFLQVYLPYEIASIAVDSFNRIMISPIEASTNGLTFYTKQIVLYESMRVNLNSTSFKIEPLQSNQPQFVDVFSPQTPTRWEWIIQAPEYTGEQIIAISVYLGISRFPSWVGSFTVNVVAPTDTPLPTSTYTPKPPTPTMTPTSTSTPTPVPDIVIIKNKIVESVSLEVCLGIPASLIVVLTLYDQIKKRLKKKKSAPRK